MVQKVLDDYVKLSKEIDALKEMKRRVEYIFGDKMNRIKSNACR